MLLKQYNTVPCWPEPGDVMKNGNTNCMIAVQGMRQKFIYNLPLVNACGVSNGRNGSYFKWLSYLK